MPKRRSEQLIRIFINFTTKITWHLSLFGQTETSNFLVKMFKITHLISTICLRVSIIWVSVWEKFLRKRIEKKQDHKSAYIFPGSLRFVAQRYWGRFLTEITKVTKNASLIIIVSMTKAEISKKNVKILSNETRKSNLIYSRVLRSSLIKY